MVFTINLKLQYKYWIIQTVYEQFNEGSDLREYVEELRNWFGFYTSKVLGDRLYCSRENRNWVKETVKKRNDYLSN